MGLGSKLKSGFSSISSVGNISSFSFISGGGSPLSLGMGALTLYNPQNAVNEATSLISKVPFASTFTGGVLGKTRPISKNNYKPIAQSISSEADRFSVGGTLGALKERYDTLDASQIQERMSQENLQLNLPILDISRRVKAPNSNITSTDQLLSFYGFKTFQQRGAELASALKWLANISSSDLYKYSDNTIIPLVKEDSKTNEQRDIRDQPLANYFGQYNVAERGLSTAKSPNVLGNITPGDIKTA